MEDLETIQNQYNELQTQRNLFVEQIKTKKKEMDELWILIDRVETQQKEYKATLISKLESNKLLS